MKQPVLLCYNLDAETARKVRLCAMRFQVRFCPVTQEKYSQSIGSLCGATPSGESPSASCAAFSDPMLVMAFFPGQLMGLFLQALRKAAVPPIALKAMLTDANAAWDSFTLHQELCRERDALQAGASAIHSSGDL